MPDSNNANVGLLDHMDAVAIVIDKEHTIQDASPLLLGLLGITREQIIGKKCWEVLHNRSSPLINCPFEQVISQGKRGIIEAEVPFIDGRRMIVHFPVKMQSKEMTIVVAVDTNNIEDYYQELSPTRNLERMVYDNINTPLLILDSDLRVLSVNNAFRRTYHFSKMKTVGLPLYKIADGCFETQKIQGYIDSIRKKNTRMENIEETIKFPNNDLRTVIICGSQFNIRKIPMPFIMLEVQDITDKKRSGPALHENEQDYQQLVEEAFEGIAIMQEGKYVYVNEAFARQIGISRREALELTNEEIWALVHSNDQQSLRERNGRLNHGVHILPQYRFRYMRPDGSICWVDSFVKRIEFGGKLSNIIFQNDVTAYINVIKELKRKESRLRAIFDTSPIAIAILNPQGYVVETTHSGIEFAGVDSLEDLKSFTIFDIPNLSDDIKERIRAGETIVFNLIVEFSKLVHSGVLPTKRRDNAYLKIGIAPLKLEGNGPIDGYIMQMADITKLVVAEKRAKTAAELAFVISDIMTHDLRNFLQRIELATELSSRETVSLQQADLNNMIRESVETANQIITDMSLTQNLLTTQLEVTSIQRALENALEKISQRYCETSLEVNFQTLDPIVMADEHLDLLFFKVLENSIIHNYRDDKRIWITVKEEGLFYYVKIADNGPGIPDHIKENILNPKKRSTGIGLVQAQLIVRKYGGELKFQDRVKDQPEQGAEVHILIPKYVKASL